MTNTQLAHLRSANNYLIDLGSTLDLFGPDTESFLEGRGRWEEVTQAWHRSEPRTAVWDTIAELAGPDVQQALETMVTADKIGFDEALASGANDRLGFDLTASWPVRKGILSSVSVPQEVREQAWTEIVEHRNLLRTSFGEIPGLFHAGDKKCHDHGLQQAPPGRWFAESQDHPLRALYYLRLSEVAGVPCYLSRKKRLYIEDLVQRGRVGRELPDPHADVKSAALACLKNQEGVLPPVAETVIVEALDRGCSPGEALLKVRASAEAVAYRRKLRELRRGGRICTVAHQAEVEKYLNELRELSKTWKTDPYEGIEYDRTRAREMVSAIPKVGAMLSSILILNGVTDVEVTVAVMAGAASLLSQILPLKAGRLLGARLTEPDPVHLFVSRWFRRDTAVS